MPDARAGRQLLLLLLELLLMDYAGCQDCFLVVVGIFFFFGATFNATPRSQSRTGAGAAEASASSSWSSSTRE